MVSLQLLGDHIRLAGKMVGSWFGCTPGGSPDQACLQRGRIKSEAVVGVSSTSAFPDAAKLASPKTPSGESQL
ncbi:MAG: hypothetical protein ABSH34_31795, partial [Verrucomicrobiota bacterium]